MLVMNSKHLLAIIAANTELQEMMTGETNGQKVPRLKTERLKQN